MTYVLCLGMMTQIKANDHIQLFSQDTIATSTQDGTVLWVNQGKKVVTHPGTYYVLSLGNYK